jgi:hypothetical protein
VPDSFEQSKHALSSMGIGLLEIDSCFLDKI